MNTAQEFFDYLQKVRFVSVRSQLQMGKRVFNYEGTGEVQVVTDVPGSIRFEENGNGSLIKNQNSSTKFHNSLRWRLVNQNIQLEHLRNGVNAAVPVVEFEINANGSWSSKSPHICGRDTYTATAWRTGPTKDQRIEFEYRTERP